MRIAFFGGSFDPPHLGHAHIARQAADRLTLDRVLFAPVGIQPLKRKQSPPAPFPDRIAMLQNMLANPGLADERFQVTDIDAPRQDGRPNYTWDTLVELRAQLAAEDQLFVLAGADSLVTLPHWHRAVELLPLARWIVAARPQFPMRQLIQALAHVAPESVLHDQGDRSPGLEHLLLAPKDPSKEAVHLYLLPDLSEDVSATAIRSGVREGLGEDSLGLAPEVHRYILAHGLYRASAGAG